MNEIESFAEELKEKTGIELFFYPEGTTAVGLRPRSDFEDILPDEEQRVTFFKFRYRDEKYIGYIYGCGITEYNYCVMIEKITENGLFSSAPLSKERKLKNILLGREGESEARAFAQKYSLPDSDCYAVCFHSRKHLGDILDIVKQALTGKNDMIAEIDEESFALIKFACDDTDYQSASDYAGFLADSVFEELDCHALIGIGGEVKNFSYISHSYRQAATAVRMSATFASKGDVHTYKEFLLVKMLEEIPEGMREQYMDELLSEEARELLDDEEMLGTAEGFLLNNLNLSETSRNLFMHRNTLLYRLDKIERITGMNIRKFSDAISFRVLTILYKLIKEQKTR